MRNHLKFLIGLFVLTFLCAIAPKPADAGFLDKLNAATNKLNQYSQKMDQTTQQMQQNNTATASTAKKFEKTKTDNVITGEWGNQVTCAGANSATCQNGMDNLVNCMNQTKGYYYKLVAANLEEKLNKGKKLSDVDRNELQEDIDSVNDAITTNQVVDPDPENPQRWLSRLSDEDQMQINQTNSKYMNEVRTDCDARFGGMSQFSGNGN